MIETRKKLSRKLTRFWRKNRVSKAQGLWYNSKSWLTSQDGLCATKQTDTDPQVPLGTLKIEPDQSFDSRRVLKQQLADLFKCSVGLINLSTRGEY